MKILVTGANGQLGSELRVASQLSAYEYLFTDVAELDITNQDAVIAYIKETGVEVVINCAAYTAVDQAEDDHELADRINRLAVENLALASKAFGAKLIHISTDYVFSGEGNIPYTETAPTSPLGVYGETKLAGEEAIQSSGCDHLIFRTSWLYSSFGRNFVKTIKQLTHVREELQVVFDQVGTPTYAADLAQMIVSIIDNGKYIEHQGVYHYSNEGVCSWYDFATTIRNLSATSCTIRPCHSDQFPSRVKRPHYSVLDKSKVKQDFSIEIPHWTTSLQKCIKLLNQQ